MSTIDDTPKPRAPLSAASVIESLSPGGPAVVALSGGVDSSVVAELAFRALGARVWAVTLTGPAVSDREVERARAVADHIGIAHVTLAIDPLQNAAYRANPAGRCYFCRQTETSALRAWGEDRGVVRYLDGVQLDDLRDDRPGLRAMNEAGFRHPLVDAGWRKTTVRAYAREVGLPNADQPSDACLASRIRHGQAITADLLGRVERAEAWLLDRGFRRVRVRTDGVGARVEVDPSELARLLDEPFATAAIHEIGSFGFTLVVLDPIGYRSVAGV